MNAERPMTRSRWAAWALMATIAAAAGMVLLREDATLRIAIHQGVEGVALRAAARQFSAAHNVPVEVFELPYDALYAAEMKSLRADRPAYDVIMVDDPWLPALLGEESEADTRLDRLTFTPGECAGLDVGDFVESTLRVSLHPDHPKSGFSTRPADSREVACGDPLYALPFVGNSQLFVTRRGLKATTWADVVDLPAASTGAMDAGYVTRVGAGNSIVTDFMPILWSLMPRDQPPSAGAGRKVPRLGLDHPEARKAFSFIHDLGEKGRALRGVVSVDDFDLTIHLVEGGASMSIAWAAWVMAIAKLPPAADARVLDAAGEGRQGALDVTQVPGAGPSLGAWLLSIPARAEQRTLARRFLLFATERQRMIEAARRGNPPPRESVLTSGELREYYFFPAQLESLRNARARPRTPYWRNIEQVLGDCLSALYDGAITEEQAWQRVHAGFDRIDVKQREVDAIRRKQGGATAEEQLRMWNLLEAPLHDFSCQVNAIFEPGDIGGRHPLDLAAGNRGSTR